MKVLIKPIPGSLCESSHSMSRVSAALARYAPPGIGVVSHPRDKADIQVLHVIGPYPDEAIFAKEYVVIQYCYNSAGAWDWGSLWRRSRMVWSYYNLPVPMGVRFLHGPLGVDEKVFVFGDRTKDVGAVTSGYVAGSGAEAIEEVADAAMKAGLSVFHLGPRDVVGMKPRAEKSWSAENDITDARLVEMYQRARWVSGLRHIEAFEMPVLEGVLCGARPIVFDRPEMRQWFRDFAVFVPEASGQELVDSLTRVFSIGEFPVREAERADIVERFNWKRIAEEFWREALA